MKIIIVGSNFGYKTFALLAKKIFKNSTISIVSPNIYKKKIPKFFLKFSNFNEALNYFNKEIDLLIVATLPQVQGKIINLLVKDDNICVKKIIFEKPISNNIQNSINKILLLKKKGTIILFNFIYPQIKCFQKCKRVFNKENINKINYNWYFKQDYFRNKKRTWKTNPKKGGGLAYYYLIHIIYNLLLITNSQFRYKSVYKKFSKNIITSVCLELYKKNLKCLIDINVNSDINKHEILLFNKKSKVYSIHNKSKDWVKGFVDSKGAKYKNNRDDLVKKNMKKIKNNALNFLKQNFIYSLRANYLVSKIYKIIKN